MFSKGKSGGAGTDHKQVEQQPSLIAGNLSITGTLVSEGDIQLDGRVEGDIEAGSITIGEGAFFTGKISADTVIVAGTVDGEISAGTVKLLPSAKMNGDVHHDSLTVDAGAYIQGSFKRRPVQLTDVSSASIVGNDTIKKANDKDSVV